MTGRERVLVTQALEGLASGDHELVAACLLALEDGEPRERSLRCRWCSSRFAWPGEREAHELRAHPDEFVWPDDEELADAA